MRCSGAAVVVDNAVQPNVGIAGAWCGDELVVEVVVDNCVDACFLSVVDTNLPERDDERDNVQPCCDEARRACGGWGQWWVSDGGDGWQ